MKRKCILLLTIGFVIVFNKVASQNLVLTPSSASQFSVCPGSQASYSVAHSATDCTYFWEITGGTFNWVGGTTATGPIQAINWGTGDMGTIKITAQSCLAGSYNGNVLYVQVPITAVYGKTPLNVRGQNPVGVNTSPTLRYDVDMITFRTRGTSEPDPFYVTTYQWELPSGWTISSQGYSMSTLKAYVDVVPDACTGGAIRVRGKNPCANLYSEWSSPHTVYRTFPNPGAISMNPSTVLMCTDVTPRTFTIAAVTGATSYTWTYPSGWQVSGSSSSNTITLVPDGLSGGNVTVKANATNCSMQSQASAMYVQLHLTDPGTPPTISYSSLLVCNGSNRAFTLNNLPAGATADWVATPSFMFDVSSGSGVNATLDASTTSMCCGGTLSYTITTACGSPPTVQRNVQVGAPDVTFTISSYPSPEPTCYTTGGIFSFQAQQLTGYPNSYSGFEWGWRNLTNSTSATEPGDVFYTFFAWDPGDYEIWTRATNECGTSALESVKNITVQEWCGWSLNAYPNPAENYLDVEVASEDNIEGVKRNEAYQITLFDSNGEEKIKTSSNDKSKRMDTSKLKNGKYILRVRYNGQVAERQIVINKK